MIVVDTNVIVAFWLPSEQTESARRLHRADKDWAVPLLWRSEFRSVLRQHMNRNMLEYSDALWVAEKSELLLRKHEQAVASSDVLKLVKQTGHSSYDCEYVVLAQQLSVQLVTGDRKVARLFPDTAVLLGDYFA